MTVASNLDLRQHLNVNLFVLNDEMTATAGGGQGVGPRLNPGMNRFTRVVTAGDSAQLPSMTDREIDAHVIVINDTANSMNVFPAAGENMNTVVNAAAAVPANSAAFFMMQRSLANWRSATL